MARLPWAHGHQRQGLRDCVPALLDPQPGCHGHLAWSFGKQEGAVQRLSRLLPHARLEPRHLAEAVLVQALVPRPAHGPGRLAIAGTVAGHPPGLGRSWIVGRRAVPIDWRAYDATVRKGRLQRYALAVVRRAVTRILQQVGRWRGRVTADRGVADVALCPWLPDVGGRS